MNRPSFPWAVLLAAILGVSAVACQKKQESPPVPSTNAQAPSPAGGSPA